MKKRIISLFMCFVMAFSLLPTAAWAELLPVTEDGQQEVVADPSGDEAQSGDAGENVGGEDADGGAGEGDEPGKPEDGAPVEGGENGESGGDNGDADAPAGEDAVPAAPQNGESGESGTVVTTEPVAEVGGKTYTSLPAALEAAKDGDTVTMLADHVTDWKAVNAGDESTLAIVTKKLTLDLNGNAVDYLMVGNVAFDAETQTITDVYPGNLTVVTTSNGTMGRIEALDFVKGTLDIQKGQIGYYESVLAGGAPAGGLTCNGDSGSVTISGGMVLGLTVGEGASVTVSGGSQHGGNWFNGGELTITGGQFSNVYFQNNGGTIAISGGTFGTITNTDGSKKISPMSLLKDGYAFFDQSNDTLKDGSKDDLLSNVTVKEHEHDIVDGKCACGMTFVASVTAKDGTVSGYYDTLDEAFQKAGWDSTVTLLTDVALAETLNVTVNYTTFVSTFALDLNGKTISCAGTDTTTVFTSATLTICDGSEGKTGEITNNAIYAVQSGQGGKLTITGGKFGKVYAIEDWTEISGGTFSAIEAHGFVDGSAKLHTLLKDGFAFQNSDGKIVNGYENTNAKDVTVVAHTHTYDTTGKCACGAECPHESWKDGKCTACGYACTHDTGVDADVNCATCGLAIVAEVKAGGTTTYHADIAGALEAAKDNGTLTVIAAEKTVALPDKNGYPVLYAEGTLTLDLNGHTLSGGGLMVGGYISGSNTRTGNLTVIDSAGGGKIDGERTGLKVQPGAKVKFVGAACSKLAVYSQRYQPAEIKFAGGVIHEITTLSDATCADLLAEGYCFYSYDETTSKVGDAIELATLDGQTKVTTPLAVGKCSHDQADDNGKCVYCGIKLAVRDNKGTIYDTLQKAINAAVEDSSIEWLMLDANMTESVVFDAAGKSVTVKMNGKTLTSADGVPLTVKNGTLTIEDAAYITRTGATSDAIDCAVSITGGELIFAGDLTALGGSSTDSASPAIAVTGGKVTFAGKVTATGGLQGVRGNAMTCKPAVYATGGELDFKGDLDLNGGLTITGSAKLTNGLRMGVFRVEYNEESVSANRVSVEGSANYGCLGALLADGYAFVKTDDQTKFPCTATNMRSWSGDVTIVAHEHTWGPGTGDNFWCTVCHQLCDHPGGFATGKCEVCGKPCPHKSLDETGSEIRCAECHQIMVAKIITKNNEGYDLTNYYANLVDALKAVKNNETITLLSDVDNTNKRACLTGDNKTATLDLNGKTVTGGWLQIGYEENWNDQTSSGLNITGSGSLTGYVNIGYFSTLDLSGWTGGTISNMDVSNDRNTKVDGKLIVGENAGTIGTLGFYNRRTASISSELSGGTYGRIEFTISDDKVSVSYSDMLAEGYAFQYVDSGEYVAYGKKASYSDYDSRSIENVKVVECEHARVTDGTCDYCNTTGIAALVSNGDGTKVYGTFAEAQTAWLASGGTLKLCQSVSNMTTAAWTGDSSKTYTLDLNGYNITAANGDDSGSGDPAYKITATDMTLTVKDSSEDAKGQLDNLTLGENSKLTLERGWLGMLTVPNDQSVKVRLQGGGLKGSDIKVPLACVLPDGYDLKEAPTLYNSGDTNNEYTVEKAPAAFTSGKEGDMHWGENKMPFTLSAALVNSETEPAKITVAWYLRDGSEGKALASGEMVKSGSGWTYDSSKEQADGQAYGNLTVGNTYEVFAVVTAADSSDVSMWRAAITGYQLKIVKADAVVTEMPTAKDLTYTGGAQALVTAGKTSGGTLKYSLTKEGPYDTKIPTGTNAGEYTVWYMVEGDSNYNGVEAQSVTVTIGKADAALTTVPVANSLTYNGSAQALVTAGSTQDGAMLYRLGENGEFGSDIPTATDAGSYTVYYKVKGDDNHKDTAEKSVTVTIGQLSFNNDNTVITLGEGLTYNGKTQTQTVASVKVGELTVPAGSYTVSKNTGAAAKDYTLTVTGTGNFTGTKSVRFTIAKAALTVPEITVDVTNGYAAAYTVDLRAALDNALAAGRSFGTVTYDSVTVVSDTKGYCNGAPKVNNGILTLAVNNVDSTDEGNVATVTVTVVTGNYQNITLTVQLNAVNKAVPVGAPTLSTRTITYGEKLNTIRLSGTMRVDGAAVKGTFAWAEPYFCPGIGGYTATWVFTPEDSKYAVVTGTADITVKKPAEPVYTVGGTVWEYNVVGDRNEQAVQGAVVTIRKGLEIIGGQKVTDKDGRFTLDGVVAGVYNVVVEYQGKTVTTKVELTNRDIDLKVEIPREDVNSKLEIENPTDLIGDVVVGGLDKEAGEQFKDSDKGSVSIGMGITEPEHKQDDEVQNAIRGSEELTGKTLDFIDMVLTMVKNGEKNNLPETTTVLEIIISYDTTRKDIKVVRHHVNGNNVVEVSGLVALDKLPDEGESVDGTFYIDYEKKCIHIFTSKFSAYAIGYTPESSNRYYYNGGTAGTKSGESPATGDVGLLPYAAMALTGCTGVVVLTFRRKREHE